MSSSPATLGRLYWIFICFMHYIEIELWKTLSKFLCELIGRIPIPSSWKIQLFILTTIAMSQTKRKRRSVPTQVRYEVYTSKNDFDEIITLPNPDDNSGSAVEWDDEVPEITYKLACKTYTENQAKPHNNHCYFF